MTSPDRHQDPLAELRIAVTPLSDAETAAAQRARVVRRMKELQLRARAPLPRSKTRKRVVAAAAILFTAGAAAAATGGWASFFRGTPDAQVTVPVKQGTAVFVPPIVARLAPAEPVTLAPAAPSLSPPQVRTQHSQRSPRHSTLAEENALLERAMAAKNSGDERHALSLLDEHLTRYPDSPVARNAELERLRALERAGDGSAARSAARRYLARYPEGMGSEEARRIATSSMKTRAHPSP